MKIIPKAAAVLGAALLSLAPEAMAQSSWKPTRPVEFVVTSGAGGGTDVFARTVQAAITKHDLLPTSVVVSNKGGGSGVEGFIYGRGARGDAHKVIFGTNNAWTLPMVVKTNWTVEDLTPVASMAFDEFMLWVKQDSPYQSAADLLRVAREKPGQVRMGGSQTHDTDQTLVVLIQRAANVRFSYIPFRGGGEAGVQLAGGHIEANTNNPSESAGGWRGGQVRPVCVFRREPLPAGAKVTETQGWSDVPTCVSQGLPVEQYRMPRTIFLPPGAPEAAQAFWTDLFQKVSQTPEFQDYITRTSQSGQFLSGEAMRSMIAADQSATREIFTAEGWLVQ